MGDERKAQRDHACALNQSHQATKHHVSYGSLQNRARLDHRESRRERFVMAASTRFGIQAKLGFQVSWAADRR